MITISKTKLTVRSGRLVAELTVSGCGELKSIIIDGEVITGNDSSNELLWFATSWLDLIEQIGTANAVKVYKQFKAVWKSPVKFKDDDNMQSLVSLIDFVQSAKRLYDNWQYFLNDNYPLQFDFEELLIDLNHWQYSTIAIIENGNW